MKGQPSIREDAASFARLLTIPRATSKFVLLFFILNIVLSGFATTTPANRELSISWHLLDLINALAASLAVAFVGVINKRRNLGRFGYAWLFLAGSLGTVATILTTAISEPHVPSFIYDGMYAGFLSNFGTLTIFTLMVSSFSESRQGLRDLVSNRLTLKTMGVRLQEDLAFERKNLDSLAGSAVASVVEDIQGQVSQLHGNSEKKNEIARALREGIDSIVRPLSHSLEFESNDLDIGTIRREISRFTFRDLFLFKIRLSDAISPIFLGIVLGSTITTTYGYLFGVAEMFKFGLPLLALAVIYMYLIRFIVGSIKVRVITAFGINLLVAILIQYIFILAHSLIATQYPADSLSIIDAGALNVALGVGIASIFYATRKEFLSEAHRLNEELLATIASARLSLWAFRKSMARSLHGGVQARLQAAALRLARAEDVTDKLLGEVRGDLEAALGKFGGESKDANFVESLNELTESWRGVCEVKAAIPDSITNLFLQDNFASECALEVINEAVTNAVKHGGADQVEIAASLRSNELVDLVISNRRTSATPTNGSGLGSRILDEATSEWRTSVDGEVFTLTATIFIASN